MRVSLLVSLAFLLLAGGSATTGVAADSTPAAKGPAATHSSAAKPTAAAPTVAEVKTPTAQTQKLARCSAEATTRKLTGTPRDAYLTSCLAAAPVESTVAATAQAHPRNCEAEAKAKTLEGAARQAFMAECLKTP